MLVRDFLPEYEFTRWTAVAAIGTAQILVGYWAGTRVALWLIYCYQKVTR